MNKSEVLEKINAIPDVTTKMVRKSEMAKDLKDLLEEKEEIQGITEICFSNIDRLFRNAINGLRGFITVTDSKIYLIIRGKLLLNTLTLLDKTYIIPRKDVIGISMEHVKGIVYTVKVIMATKKEVFEFYTLENFEAQMPKEILQGNKRKRQTEGINCPVCGYKNVANAAFCGECGEKLIKDDNDSKILEKQQEE